MAAGKNTAAALDAWIVFEDDAGFAITPSRARIWGRRGHTLVVRVRGRSRRRISVAALCCYKPGEKSGLIYRPRFHLPFKGARKSFACTDCRDLLIRAHIQLQHHLIDECLTGTGLILTTPTPT
ncbi:transposase [Streptomyces sp. NPDC047515]|uniref:transposase n=1 Tax=Streptomyces sp. NPDC047515 TaxID=3155380 RepID=UPI0034056F17